MTFIRQIAGRAPRPHRGPHAGESETGPIPPGKSLIPLPDRGRPPFEPSDEQRELVGHLSGLGLRQPEICALVKHNGRPIHRDTLRKYFREELDMGKADLIRGVKVSLKRQALLGSVPAIKLVLNLNGYAEGREAAPADESSVAPGDARVALLAALKGSVAVDRLGHLLIDAGDVEVIEVDDES